MDELLLRRAQQGDPEAFEKLAAGVETLIWRVCWHYTGNREDASDCAQDAMLKLWRNLGAFRFECAFETWAYRVAVNCCMDYLRKARRTGHVSLEPLAEQGFDPPDPSPGTEETALQRDEQARLRQAILELPPDQRDALVLTQLEGKSYEEVARMTEVSEGTVKSRVNRARNRLKELFVRGGEPFQPERVQTGEPQKENPGTREKERRGRS